MCYSLLLLFIIHNLQAITAINSNGTLNLNYRCSPGEDYRIRVWDSQYGDKIHSITIENCNILTLDISKDDRGTHILEHLNIKNINSCTVRVTKHKDKKYKQRTILPCQSNFENIGSFKIYVPLYTEKIKKEIFSNCQLIFKNVTFDKIISNSVRLDNATMKKFSLMQVNIRNAEENAISFRGDLLNIENSFFFYVPKNFIRCTAEKIRIWNNTFGTANHGSFSLETESIDVFGNTVRYTDGLPLELLTFTTLRRRKAFDDPLFHNTIKISKENDSNINQGRPFSSIAGVNKHGLCSKASPLKDFTLEDDGKKQKIMLSEDNDGWSDRIVHNMKDLTSFRGKKILLIWLLAVFLLILLFPIAYFIKIGLSKTIDSLFSVRTKHQLLESV